jgi:hypothetical protein
MRIERSWDDSDHWPLIAKWNNTNFIKIEKQVRRKRMIPHRIEKKKKDIANDNVFDSISDNDYQSFVDTIWNVASKYNCVSVPNVEDEYHNKLQKYFDNKTRRIIRKRNRRYKKFLKNPSEENYNNLKGVKLELRRDLKKIRKVKYYKSHQQFGEYIQNSDIKNAFSWINKFAVNPKTRSENPIIDPATGTILTDQNKLSEYLCKHFSDLAKDTTGNSRNFEHWKQFELQECPALKEINNNLEWEEISSIIKNSSNYKSPGIDGITNEFLKVSLFEQDKDNPNKIPNKFAEKLFKIIKYSWDNSICFDTWNKTVVVPVPKKGNLENIDNYRGISLISNVQKIISAILGKRILKEAIKEKKIIREQVGFISREEAIGQALCLQQIIEKRANAGLETYTAFIDLAKAYDSVPHGALIYKINKFGIRGKALKWFKKIYEKAEICCRKGETFTDSYPYQKGVRQGDPSSPILFNIFMNDLLDEEMNEKGVEFEKKNGNKFKICALLFANDIVFISN